MSDVAQSSWLFGENFMRQFGSRDNLNILGGRQPTVDKISGRIQAEVYSNTDNK